MTRLKDVKQRGLRQPMVLSDGNRLFGKVKIGLHRSLFIVEGIRSVKGVAGQHNTITSCTFDFYNAP